MSLLCDRSDRSVLEARNGSSGGGSSDYITRGRRMHSRVGSYSRMGRRIWIIDDSVVDSVGDIG